jgi:hypothetical protein
MRWADPLILQEVLAMVPFSLRRPATRRALHFIVPVFVLACVLPAAGAYADPLHTASPRFAPLPSTLRADRIVLAPGVDAASYGLMRAETPGFARQTGLACSVCHYGFPELTLFGRMFKLNAYALTGLKTIPGVTATRHTLGLAPIPPASAMAVVSLPHMQTSIPDVQNDAASFPDELSLFLTGQVTPRVGAFVQITYDGQEGSVGIDNTEIRFANHATVASHDLLYGLTLHNNPTVQDVWNTTPAWGFPFASSPVAPSPAASALVDGTLAQSVLGLGAYALWNEWVYAEFTAYRSAPQGGAAGSNSTDVLDGVAPYWRVALQHQFGRSYAMIGSYGLAAHLFPSGLTGPTNRYVDVGVDAQLEHALSHGALILRSTYLHEEQRLDGLLAESPQGAEKRSNTLRTFRANLSYMPDTRVALTGGYFDIGGTRDTVLFAPAPLEGSAAGRPDSDGFIAELDFNAWENMRLGAQYVAYQRCNGRSKNFDGSGRDASNNNTVYIFVWTAF